MGKLGINVVIKKPIVFWKQRSYNNLRTRIRWDIVWDIRTKVQLLNYQMASISFHRTFELIPFSYIVHNLKWSSPSCTIMHVFIAIPLLTLDSMDRINKKNVLHL